MDTISQKKLKIGTCAWSYDDWRGTLYPSQLPKTKWLEYYSRHFSSVEVDSTFYRTPGLKGINHWLEQTPAAFRFTVKMPRKITHLLRLRNCKDELNGFLEGIDPLRPKLGCVLVQLPASFNPKKDEKGLKTFVATLPPSFRFAIEFRHPEWHLPHIVHYLEDHGICWVWNDITSLKEQTRGAFEPLPQTTDFLYIRLLGEIGARYHADGTRIYHYGALKWPRDSSLESWAIKITKHLQDSESAYVFAGNHFEGCAPITAQRVGHLLHAPIEIPCVQDSAPLVAARQIKLL